MPEGLVPGTVRLWRWGRHTIKARWNGEPARPQQEQTAEARTPKVPT
jgi:hypothetical protein